MDDLQIYQTAKRGTASGRGPSYWATPMLCGRKAYLQGLEKDNGDDETRSDALRIGTFYHFLHELWQNENSDNSLCLDSGVIQDPAWTEAVRLFNFISTVRPKHYFGKTVATETRLPVNDHHQQAIEKFFGIKGEDCPTGQIDLLTCMSEEDVARVEREREVDLRGPGLYIIDYKTAAARASETSARADYTETVQAMTYPLLWNLNKGVPIKGMIFDVLVKHKKLGENSMQTFVAHPCPSHGPIVRNAVRIALASKHKARANPYACYYKGYECTYLRNAQCSRI